MNYGADAIGHEVTHFRALEAFIARDIEGLFCLPGLVLGIYIQNRNNR
jgi:hypothetical protein